MKFAFESNPLLARRHRRGSVLILVVALLVLLALIGTAFITTTGTDRLSSSQSQANTQVDLLIDGVVQMAIQQTVEKVAPADIPGASGKPSFRPAIVTMPGTPVPQISQFNKPPQHFTNVDYATWDPYLAQRTPDGVNTGSGLTPGWSMVSASPLARNRDANFPNVFPRQFSSPLVTTTAQPAPSVGSQPVIGSYHSRAGMLPCSVSVRGSDGTLRVYPAMQLIDQQLATYTGTDQALVQGSFQKLVLAADADGDGTADSCLFELPMGQQNGIKYYAAVRIIDNSAAINASMAWTNINDTSVSANDRARMPINVFATNIDLFSLLAGSDRTNFPTFNTWRFNAATMSTVPVQDVNQVNFQYANQFDALYTALGARLDNPGRNGGNRTRALGVSEEAVLRRRGGLVDVGGSQSQLERYFPIAMSNSLTRAQPYAANQYVAWFNTIYNYNQFVAANTAAPLRPIVSAVNPRSNFTPAFIGNPSANLELPVPPPAPPPTQERQRAGKYRYRGDWNGGTLYRINEWVRVGSQAFVCISANTGVAPSNANPASMAYWAQVPWYHHPVAINVNTASFGQLMAAYYAVMGDGPEVKDSTYAADGSYGGSAGQIFTFGNVMRSNGGQPLSPQHVKQLRAAIAAVNTIDLRDADDDVTSRTVVLTDENGANPRTVKVYGTERQPYISSCTVNIDEMDRAWVILELFNPYPIPLRLDAFSLVYRQRGGPTTMTEIGNLNGKTLPPFGYIKIESAATQRPPDVAAMGNIDTPTVPEQMPKLADIVEASSGLGELLLLRTRQQNGTPSSSTHPANSFNEAGNNFIDWIPADVLEFTGIASGLNNTITVGAPPMPRRFMTRYHYRRATEQNSGNFTNRWHTVYAGPYDRSVVAGGADRPMRGWVKDPRPPTPMPDPATSPFMYSLTLPGFGDKQRGPDGIAHNEGNYNPQQSTYRTRCLQHAALGFGGPYKPLLISNESIYQNPAGNNSQGRAAPAFPVGGFARNGDILQVTYVGAYRIDPVGPGMAEMNSVSVDAAFAEDGDKNDDDDAGGNGNGPPREQLGRFAPLYTAGGAINDLEGTLDPLVPKPTHRYAWASDLFDYLTVLCPQDDYLPNVDPTGWQNGSTNGADPTLNGAGTHLRKFPQYAAGSTAAVATNTAPEALANGPTVTTPAAAALKDGREDTTPVHGQINLNTANWFVISTIPWTNTQATNRQIAQAIVAHREGVGPFRNLFDLAKVNVGGTALPDMMGATGALNPTNAQGDITPLVSNIQAAYAGAAADDGVAGDFEARYLMITRVSNMVSFRSDGFTAYVIVQGWRNAGTPSPELVVQRRAAVIIDRSAVRPILPAGSNWTNNITYTAPTVTNVPQN